MSLAGAAPGWYGKIASLGDFAGRRLPPEFITAIDHWLQRVIPESRQHLGEGWMDAYLTGPVWRFLFFPGVIGPGLWAGVMMPSVDKVGRYFPLLIAGSFERLPVALDDWLGRLEDIALSTLDTTGTPESLEARLQECPPPKVPDAGGATLLQTLTQAAPRAMSLPNDVQSVDAAVISAALTALSSTAQGHCLWWPSVHHQNPLTVITSIGLPDALTFATLLNGGLAPASFEPAIHATPP